MASRAEGAADSAPIPAEYKPVAWAVAGIAMVAISSIIAAVAGPILAFVLIVILAAVIVGAVLFLTETPESIGKIFKDIKQTFEKIPTHFKKWQQEIARLSQAE